MVADDYAQQFNRLASSKGLPQRIAFLPVSVVHIPRIDEEERAQDAGATYDTYSIEPCTCLLTI